MTDKTNPSSRLLWGAVAASALLMIVGGAGFYFASVRNAEVMKGQRVDATMTVTTAGCSPNALSVAGGSRTFEIVNEADRPIEWEILDGVLVVAERENIAPGYRQTLTVQLRPGTYQMACGLLSNPRGTLTVSASDEASAAAAAVTTRRFLGPLSEYRVATIMGAGKAVKAAEALRDAIAAGDIDAARTAWKAARLTYRQIEPLASRLSDLENRIDPVSTYLAAREADPAFTGYHRIEYGLFDQNSMSDLQPVADQLVGDLGTLQSRLKDLAIDPDLLMTAPAALARLLADTQVPNGEDAYAHSDVAEFAASAAALRQLVVLFDPLLKDVAPDLQAKLDADLGAIDTTLAGLAGEADYTKVDAAQRQQLAGQFATLATDLDGLPKALGAQ